MSWSYLFFVYIWFWQFLFIETWNMSLIDRLKLYTICYQVVHFQPFQYNVILTLLRYLYFLLFGIFFSLGEREGVLFGCMSLSFMTTRWYSSRQSGPICNVVEHIFSKYSVGQRIIHKQFVQCINRLCGITLNKFLYAYIKVMYIFMYYV